MASIKGVQPSGAVVFMLAPSFNNSSTIFECPLSAAIAKAV